MGRLLGEEWLEDDIANSLLELLYFRSASANPISPPIFLPTFVFQNAQSNYLNNEPQSVGGACLRLRHILSDRSRTMFGALILANNHYTAYRSIDFTKMEYGDSLGGVSTEDIATVMNWAAANPRLSFTLPVHGDVNLQGLGSGSCGIASLNFIHRAIDQTIPKWTQERSLEFRLQNLYDLITYHICAANHPVSIIVLFFDRFYSYISSHLRRAERSYFFQRGLKKCRILVIPTLIRFHLMILIFIARL